MYSSHPGTPQSSLRDPSRGDARKEDAFFEGGGGFCSLSLVKLLGWCSAGVWLSLCSDTSVPRIPIPSSHSARAQAPSSHSSDCASVLSWSAERDGPCTALSTETCPQLGPSSAAFPCRRSQGCRTYLAQFTCSFVTEEKLCDNPAFKTGRTD